MKLPRLLLDARKEALKRDYIVKSCAVFATVIFPVAEGLLRSLKPQKDTQLWWAFFISIAILHLLTVAVTIVKVKDIQRYYFEFTDVAEELKNSKDRTASLEDQTASLQHAGVVLKNSIGQLQRVLQELPTKNPLTYADIETYLNRMFQAFDLEKEAVFSYRAGISLFNLVIYLFDDRQNQLVVLKRWHDNRIPVQNRPWTPPKGHVGFTFAARPGQTYFNPDISTHPELWVGTEEDKKYYRATISTPICYQGLDENRFRGVLTITSNVAGQFNLATHTIILETITKMLTIFFNATTLSNQKMISLKQTAVATG
jgi:hypothetical protein